MSCIARMCLLTDYILKSPNSNMQTLTQLKIEEPEIKESFLEILSDKYCRAILEAIMDTPKSAIEVSREKIIPLSTVYRRIQQLHDSKMIRTSGIITDEGKIDVEVVFNKN